jgi:hypothetical protein
MSSYRTFYHLFARFLLAFVCLLAGCGPVATSLPPPSDTPVPPTPTIDPMVSLAMAYEEAMNSHDIDEVVALFSQYPIFLIPSSGNFEADGLNDVQKAHELEIGLNIEVHFTECKVSENRVVCKLSLAEDCVRSSRIGTIPGVITFTNNEGKIQIINWDLSSMENTTYIDWWNKFNSWFSATYPDQLAGLTDWFSKETGTIVSARCKEYAATLQ